MTDFRNINRDCNSSKITTKDSNNMARPKLFASCYIVEAGTAALKGFHYSTTGVDGNISSALGEMHVGVILGADAPCRGTVVFLRLAREYLHRLEVPLLPQKLFQTRITTLITKVLRSGEGGLRTLPGKSVRDSSARH